MEVSFEALTTFGVQTLASASSLERLSRQSTSQRSRSVADVRRMSGDEHTPVIRILGAASGLQFTAP